MERRNGRSYASYWFTSANLQQQQHKPLNCSAIWGQMVWAVMRVAHRAGSPPTFNGGTRFGDLQNSKNCLKSSGSSTRSRRVLWSYAQRGHKVWHHILSLVACLVRVTQSLTLRDSIVLPVNGFSQQTKLTHLHWRDVECNTVILYLTGWPNLVQSA